MVNQKSYAVRQTAAAAFAYNSARSSPPWPPVEGTLISRLAHVLYSYSEGSMLAIRLPESIEKRLEKLARRTGRTKTFYARQAIIEHLDDLEDLYLAERALDRIRSGDEQTIPLEDALKRHGLED